MAIYEWKKFSSSNDYFIDVNLLFKLLFNALVHQLLFLLLPVLLAYKLIQILLNLVIHVHKFRNIHQIILLSMQ